MSKWHKRDISKGTYGELSKIKEELEEAIDAEEQGQDLMLMFELSDIIGACAGVAQKYGMSLDQLVKFSKLRSEVAIADIQHKARQDLLDFLYPEGIKITPEEEAQISAEWESKGQE